MSRGSSDDSARPCWFVGAAWGGIDDQTAGFVAEGIWKNGFTNKYNDLVRSMRPGDHVAIKASYVRKHGLPFDGRGEFVSVMAIKAVGTITKNMGDGQVVRVRWLEKEPPGEWFFFTSRRTVWRVEPGEWKADNLIAFAFDNKPQDIQRFLRE